ncbi:transposase family protein [Microcoleus sp. PH2017_21_RUC_O_A]|uniref:transposase family protein n=1 Tax=Microcoleus sp. PH2017_21_RUC_O_A TaxID=2798832 RepID=UPI0025E8D3A4|nr:transposase family protein [Microcoleus sp. PH2017_21_RUC_O_A]
MDFHLDGLLNLPDITIERCIKNDKKTILKVGFLTENATCPHCQQSRDELHQIRPILIRDLPISGQLIELEIPRRQYYCKNCQKYFTEQLCFVDEGRRYTQRYEEYIYHRVQVTTVSQVKREEELSWDQIQGIFNHQRSQVKKPHGEQLNV